ncbi:MAG: aldolase/citrate lyase family protein, partial [Vicinamibacterales bacterium]
MASLLRSVLFVPGTRADRFPKAIAAGADAIVLDLEDGVEPGRKADARRAVAEWLTSAPASRAGRFVRVNSVQSPWIDADLAWLPGVADLIDAVVLPKAESPGDVERVAARAPGRRVV